MQFLKSHGFIIGLSLFVIAASWLFIQPEPELQGKIDLSPIPKNYKEYTSREVDLSDMPIDDQLAPQAILMRDYFNNEGTPITLCLVYNYERRNVSFHDPNVCYPAQGFDLINKGIYPVNAADQNVPANMMTASRNGETSVVLYWYLSKNRPVVFEGSRKGDVKTAILSRLKRTVGVSSMVRVSAPITTSEEDTTRQLVSYLKDLYPKILEVKAPLQQQPMPATRFWNSGTGGRMALFAILGLPLLLALFSLPAPQRENQLLKV